MDVSSLLVFVDHVVSNDVDDWQVDDWQVDDWQVVHVSFHVVVGTTRGLMMEEMIVVHVIDWKNVEEVVDEEDVI